MKKEFDNPTWWHYIAIFLLTVTITTVIFCVFSFCVHSKVCLINSKASFVLKSFLNTMFHTSDNFGQAIGLAYMTIFTLVASWCFAGAALLGIVIGLLKKYSVRIYIWSLIISTLPMVGLTALHFMGI